MPDVAQHPPPILSQNKSDVLVGISASYEGSGEIVDSLLPLKPGDYFVRSMNMVSAVGFRKHLFEQFGRA